MAPQKDEVYDYAVSDDMEAAEGSPLMADQRQNTKAVKSALSFEGEAGATDGTSRKRKAAAVAVAAVAAAAAAVIVSVGALKKERAAAAAHHRPSTTETAETEKPTGPYRLVERQVGPDFFDYYDFYDGPDSLGSAGYNTYIGREKAIAQGLANVTVERNETFVYMKSNPTPKGPRDSVRLEGKRRFDRGLFVMDVAHMPAGAGVWPAWWLTDEKSWPSNGEIDIVEGVNRQSVAKTALHTSDRCSMYAHVPSWSKTGYWDSATGIPDTYTGAMDFHTWKEADDCWVMAAHQWANQGCVTISSQNDTLGEPLNRRGGGVYALEWDPENRYIRSWVFNDRSKLPTNLINSMKTSGSSGGAQVAPNTTAWGLPYAYFAIGEGTGCSADHFKNMRLVFNLAFCGTVAGNRFFGDCPEEAAEFKVKHDPILSCNAYIKSEPRELDEAYWKIKGVYVYEREMEPVPTKKATASGEQ